MGELGRKEVLDAINGLKGFRKELATERTRLKGSMKTLRGYGKDGKPPEWAKDVSELFGSSDYSYWKLIKLMRKNKIL